MPKTWWILIIVCLIGSATDLWAVSPTKNLIYITLDGVGQRSFFQLQRKNKLPAIQSVINRGNVRTMFSVSNANPQHSYQALWAGLATPKKQIQKILPGSSIFEWVSKHFPKKSVAILLSKAPDHPSLSNMIPHLEKTPIHIGNDVPRTAWQAVSVAKAYLKSRKQSSFFLFLNLTDAEKIGHQYRADGEEYSLAIQAMDRALGTLFAHLKQVGDWDSTDIIITTSYAFNTKNRIHENTKDIWIASTQKVFRKARISDIVPSIKASYQGVDQDQGVVSIFKDNR